MGSSLSDGEAGRQLPMRRVVTTWWPLALSWLLMAVEVPAISAVVARLANPDVHLAAFGGIVYPLTLIVGAPMIMLLAASTALSKDWDSYRKLWRVTMLMGGVLTGIHALFAFTPLYDAVIVRLMDPPAEIIEPARVGLMVAVFWNWAVGFRRFQQGVLIRFGHSRAVGVGSFVRLGSIGIVLGVGYGVESIPGIVVAASALALGVICEAVYTALRARSVIQGQLRDAPPVKEPLTLRGFTVFYIPLAMTAMLGLLAEPLKSVALTRMPRALDSLAVWSVVNGLIFIFRSAGMAYNEVVIALLDEPGSLPTLRRFTTILSVVVTVLLVAVSVTPVAMFWFENLTGLRPELARFSHRGLWYALFMPGVFVLQSWYQGLIVHSRRTRGVSEAVLTYILASGALLLFGVLWDRVPGLYVAMAALSLGRLAQTVWLWYRSRPAVEGVDARDRVVGPCRSADLPAM